MKLLVTGGAGYIGSHMCKALSKAGHEVWIFDNLSTGDRNLAIYGKLIIGDLLDRRALNELFSAHAFDAVMHFASLSQVAESVKTPEIYYRNNVVGSLNLLDAMATHKVRYIIFSSTAAIFGEPLYTPIDEEHPKIPITPYGASKLMVERLLKDFFKAHGLHSVSLRYFNAAGADPEGDLGECHNPETHLIPLVLQAVTNPGQKVKIFGDDYDTPDGTCIRDYIHVNDLCTAHTLALEGMVKGFLQGAKAYNLGNGEGYSVKHIISITTKIVASDGYNLRSELHPRRSGDPARLVADARRANRELHWYPKYADIETIIRHAWEYHSTA